MSASTEKKLRQAAREAGTDKKTLAAREAAEKQRKSKIKWTVGTVITVLVVAMIIFLSTGFLYTGTVAMSINGVNYSPAEVNYYYATQYDNWSRQYGQYAYMFGLDPSRGLAGLKSQSCPMLDGGTWSDYFLDGAEQEMVQTQAILDYAAENGISLTEEETALMDSSFDGMEEQVKSRGFGSLDKFFAANYGRGVDTELVRQGGLDSMLVSKAMQSVADTFEYSDAQLEEYYKSLNGEKDVFDYVYYTVSAETVESTGEDGETVNEATDETRAEAKAKAEAIMKAYEESEETDYTARLSAAAAAQVEGAEANLRKNTPAGGLGSYKEWLMGSRKAGDINVIASDSGNDYYIVVFVSRSDNHYPVAQVRHILIQAAPAEDGSYTDEAKAAAKAEAEMILKEFQNGDKTEESFAALANEHSMDPGSNTNGGLYDAVSKGQMIEEFDRFCFEGHKSGDTAIIYGESGGVPGYHIMYYVGEGELFSNLIAENDLMNQDMEKWLTETAEGYTAERKFWFNKVG